VSSLAASAATAQENIKPEQAAKYVDKDVVVVMAVRFSAKEKRKGTCYLNSQKFRTHPTNLAIVIPAEVAGKLAKGSENPDVYYLGKTIKVSGKVEFSRGQNQIKLADAAQLQLVSETAAPQTEEEAAMPPSPSGAPQPESNWLIPTLVIALILLVIAVVWLKRSKKDS